MFEVNKKMKKELKKRTLSDVVVINNLSQDFGKDSRDRAVQGRRSTIKKRESRGRVKESRVNYTISSKTKRAKEAKALNEERTRKTTRKTPPSELSSTEGSTEGKLSAIRRPSFKTRYIYGKVGRQTDRVYEHRANRKGGKNRPRIKRRRGEIVDRKKRNRLYRIHSNVIKGKSSIDSKQSKKNRVVWDRRERERRKKYTGYRENKIVEKTLLKNRKRHRVMRECEVYYNLLQSISITKKDRRTTGSSQVVDQRSSSSTNGVNRERIKKERYIEYIRKYENRKGELKVNRIRGKLSNVKDRYKKAGERRKGKEPRRRGQRPSENFAKMKNLTRSMDRKKRERSNQNIWEALRRVPEKERTKRHPEWKDLERWSEEVMKKRYTTDTTLKGSVEDKENATYREFGKKIRYIKRVGK